LIKKLVDSFKNDGKGKKVSEMKLVIGFIVLNMDCYLDYAIQNN